MYKSYFCVIRLNCLYMVNKFLSFYNIEGKSFRLSPRKYQDFTASDPINWFTFRLLWFKYPPAIYFSTNGCQGFGVIFRITPGNHSLDLAIMYSSVGLTNLICNYKTQVRHYLFYVIDCLSTVNTYLALVQKLYQWIMASFILPFVSG